MKTIILLFVLLLTTTAYAETDYTCGNDCTSQGYLYNYCTNLCSYKSYPHYEPKRIKQIDYKCVNDCTGKGYLYNYCTQYCSY